MGKTASEIERFQREADLVALRLRRRWRPFARTRLSAACFGYVVRSRDLRGEVVKAGEPVAPEGEFDAWAFRAGVWELDVEMRELTAADGLSFEVELVLLVELEPREVDIKLFLSRSAPEESLSSRDLAQALAPGLRETLGRELEALRSAKAVALDARSVRDLLGRSGEELFFERGLRVVDVRRVRVACEAHERLRREDAELVVAEERMKRRLRRIELWKSEALARERARHEVMASRGAAPEDRPAGAGAPESGTPEPAPVRLLLCGGTSVWMLDPDDGSPREIASFSGGDLGYLRSVRSEPAEGGRVVLAGAQRGVYIEAGLSGAGRREVFRLPREPERRGGVNAVVRHGPRLYATHSEIGLVAWRAPGSPVVIFDARDREASSTRGIQRGADGLLYFAAGDEVIALDPEESDRILEPRGEARGEVTAFAAGYGEVVAGTRDGRLLLWEDAEGPPIEVTKLGAHAVSAVRPVFLEGEVRYAVAAGDHALTVFSPRSSGDRSYRAPHPVRWAGAGGGRLFGIDRAETSLFIWRSDECRAPVRTVRLPDRVRDLWVEDLPA